MLPTYPLSLRDGLEMALIIGIVFGALTKIHRNDFSAIVWLGTLSGIGISILTAMLLTTFGLWLKDQAAQIFEGITMFIAAVILTWMIFWMTKQARFLKSELEAGVNKAVTSEGKRAIFWLAFVAVVREAVELALFITAVFFTGNQSQLTTNIIQIVAGTIRRLSTVVLLGWTLFVTTIRLDLRRFFRVTGIPLILFAAGLLTHGIHELNKMGWIPAVMEYVWDLNPILDESSLVGEMLKTLFGYNGNSSLTEMIAYFAYLILVSIFWRRHDSAPVKAIALPRA